MKKIDTHCHIFAPEYLTEVEQRKFFNIRTRPPIWSTAEARIADMDKMGIERQVLSLSNPLVYFPDDALNLHLSQMVNDLIADACKKYPARFSGFVAVPLLNMKDALGELKRSFTAPGMVGIVIGAHINGKPLASPEFEPFFEEANRMKTTIFIHPVNPVGIEKVGAYQDFYRSVGFLWETTMAVGRMALAGTFEKFPNIKWILSHLGGAIPFVYTSFDVCQKRNLNNDYMAPRPASEYIRQLYVDTARHFTKPLMDCALDLYGEGRIMFGSDIPFAYDVARLNVDNLDGTSMPQKLRQQICYENAQKLLNL